MQAPNGRQGQNQDCEVRQDVKGRSNHDEQPCIGTVPSMDGPMPRESHRVARKGADEDHGNSPADRECDRIMNPEKPAEFARVEAENGHVDEHDREQLI